jgi:hypothetical protein
VAGGFKTFRWSWREKLFFFFEMLAGEAGRESFGVLEGFGVLGFWREFLGLFCAKQ